MVYVAVLLGESPYGVGEGIVLDDVRRDIEHRCLVDGRAEGRVEQRRVLRDVRGIHCGKQVADCLRGFVEGEGLRGDLVAWGVASEHGKGDCGEAAELGLDPLGEAVPVQCADGAWEQWQPVCVCRRPGACRDGPKGQPDDEHAFRRAQVGSEGDKAFHPAAVSAAYFLVGLPEIGQGGSASFGTGCLGVVLRCHGLGVVLVEGGFDVVGEPLVPGDGQQVLKGRASVGG